MAQPPKPPTSEERRAEAAAEAQAAGRRANHAADEESRRLADRLIAGAAAARFDAQASPKLRLTSADRRRLLHSLIGHEPPRRVVPAGIASR